jgi:hypothetical protein
MAPFGRKSNSLDTCDPEPVAVIANDVVMSNVRP